MPIPSFVGSDLIQLANDALAGYQGSVDSGQLLGYLNEAKDEVWGILKSLNDQYFQVLSQATNPAADFYFAPLSNTVREYTLPPDLREIKFVECTSLGFTDLKFIYCKDTDEGFRRARMSANDAQSPTPNQESFYYTIFGKDQFILADFPPTTITLTLWYIRALPDFEASDPIDQILFPYNKKLVDYACQRAMLGVQDATQFTMWKQTWKDSVIYLAQDSQRNQADPIFVQGMDDGDFW